MLDLSLAINIGTRIGGFSPASIFAASEPGGWYDPSDLSTLYQDSAGTTPVTAPGQTVGMVLDKSQGLVLGPELVTNGTFDTDTGWTKETGWSISGGRANSSAVSGFGAILQSKPELVEGRAYRVSFEITSYTSGTVSLAVGANGGVAINSGNKNAVGVYTFVGTFPVGATKQVYARQENGFVGSIDNISVKELPGNHLSQPTLANRPIYGIEPFGGRRNLLTYTEQFDNAVWLKQAGTSVVANQAVAPDGTTTADLVTGSGTSGIHLASGVTGTAGIATTKSIYLRGVSGGETVYLKDAAATVGVTTCTLTTSWQRFTLSETVGVNSQLWVDDIPAGGILVWGAQLEAGSTATAYQRVVTAFDVTEAGVPSLSYIQFDGSDDSYVSPTITPGIDKAQVFAGVRQLADTTGSIAETSADSSTNNGAFSLFTLAGADDVQLLSRGTTAVNIRHDGATEPFTAVYAGTADIAADGLVLRSNGTQVNQSTSDQGTGNYLAYPLYVGRRGGTTLPYNGRIYSLIVRFGANLSASTITQTENWVAGKTGITI